jgi:putative ABC transport system ATP-binding protein
VFRGEDPVSRKEVGMSLMRRFGIIAQADKFPNQLSGGQKQRVAIARSLVNDPGIILADEPVGNLDSESAENVLAILKDLNEVDKKTIIMVTHNPEHLAYADRVIFMKDGRVVKEEINRDKRPSTAAASKTTEPEERFSKDSPEALELQMLMESFKNLLPKQVDILLIPFKAKQLLSHIISEMNDEQISMAEALLKERLFNNIDAQKLERSLDMNLEEGGGGWNSLRAISFTKKVEALIKQAAIIKEDPRKGLRSIAEYLVESFHLKFTQESWPRFVELLKLRIENQMGQMELLRNLDAPVKKGGVGLNRITAEKIVREIEIILLLKYS